MASNVKDFVESIEPGDSLWVGSCGGTVARVQTEGIADHMTAALVYFVPYGVKIRGACLKCSKVMRISVTGAVEDSGGSSGLSLMVGRIEDASHKKGGE